MKNPDTIKDIILNSENLPNLPQVLLDLLDAVNSEGALDNLSTIVSRDPGLTAQVMKLVNSPYMGIKGGVGSLDDAVVYLGVDTIKNMAISASVLTAFKGHGPAGDFSMDRFWFHSFFCAVAAKKIAQETGVNDPDEAFLAGLLHDIGKLVLRLNFSEITSEMAKEKSAGAGNKKAAPDQKSTVEIEKSVGLPHAEVGGMLARKWRLGSLLADAIHYHHAKESEAIEAFPLVGIVWLANRIGKGDASELAAGSPLFDLAAERLREIAAAAAAEAGEVAASFGMQVAGPLELAEENKGVQEAKRKRIAAEVREITLLHGTLENLLKAGSLPEILGALERSMQLLFDVGRMLIFLYDGERNELVGHPGGGNRIPSGLTVTCRNRKSLLARALDTGEPMDSLGIFGKEEESIVDGQMVRLLGSDGLFLLPMRCGASRVGVVAVGASEAQMRVLSARARILARFAAHAAVCVHVERMKAAQAELVRKERMEASMTAVRKVVHEVNNPLGIIRNYLQILGFKLPEKHPAQEELSIIGEEIERVSQTVRQLSTLEAPGEGESIRLSINRLIGDLLKLINPSMLAPAKVVAHIDLDDGVPEMTAVKNLLVQVLMNLIKNAAEAMAEGGNIHIATEAKRNASDMSATGVIIRIRDDGPGLPEKVRKAAFEPFVSTKGAGHSGLGLSIAHGSVRELGGTLSCQSGASGTEFTITLPLERKR